MCVWSIVYFECHHLKNEHVFRGKLLFPGVHGLYLGRGTSNFLNSRFLLKNIFPKRDRLYEDRSRNKHGRSPLSGKDLGWQKGEEIFWSSSCSLLSRCQFWLAFLWHCAWDPLKISLVLGSTEKVGCFRTPRFLYSIFGHCICNPSLLGCLSLSRAEFSIKKWSVS